ncbi:SBP bac 3 domain containing protein [Asbolus verrucosus]|uniref:SBP bac 3 domain containing protein n=1 Tax=Asbolus verrucosus TaxID=1661398 RepID=A0A482VE91_ASBVE|nr:SBP bac 3 domain containing protein [Asbolus verrucosus]
MRVITLQERDPKTDLTLAADFVIRILSKDLNKLITIEEKILENSCNFSDCAANMTRSDPIEFSKFPIQKIMTDSFEGHLIIVRTEEVLLQFLEENHRIILSSPRDSYGIVFVEPSAAKILATFWHEYRVANIIAQDCFSGDTYMYLCFNGGTLRVLHNYSRIAHLMNFNQYKLKVSMHARRPTAITKFPKSLRNNPIYKNLEPLKDFVGLDGSLLRAIAEHLNLQVELIPLNDGVRFGKVLRNGTVTGTLGDVVYSRAQISTNGRFLMDYGTKGVEFTVPYSSDQICIVVPKACKVPEFIALLHCFSLSSWLAIISFFMSSNIVWYLMGTRRNSLWEMYAIFHGIPVRILPTVPQALFLMSCMGFSIIVLGLVQGSFFKAFTKPTYYKDINTLEELDSSGLPMAPTFFNFATDNSTVMSNLNKRRSSQIIGDIFDMIAHQRNVTSVVRKRDNWFRLKTSYLDKDSKSLLHLVDECFATFFVSFIVSKDLILLPTINNVITRLFESGLTLKWYSDVQFSIYLEKLMAKGKKKELMRPFSLKDIRAAFSVWILGLFLATLTFSFEIMSTRSRKLFNPLKKCIC